MKPRKFTDSARALVEGAPNYGREPLVEYVAGFLETFAKEQQRIGALEARETLLRSEVAFYEANAAQATGRANERRNELNELLEALGKSRVWPPA